MLLTQPANYYVCSEEDVRVYFEEPRKEMMIEMSIFIPSLNLPEGFLV